MQFIIGAQCLKHCVLGIAYLIIYRTFAADFIIPTMTKSIKISVLWLLTICGFTAHSICDVLPMFWGKNMAARKDGWAVLLCG